jgi:hypothetical protein
MAQEEVREGEEASVGLPVASNGIPPISFDLLQFLERTYPPRCKKAIEPLEVHMEYSGHVALISKMRKWYSEQRNPMTNSPKPIPPETQIITDGAMNTNGVLSAARAAGPRMGARRGVRRERT